MVGEGLEELIELAQEWTELLPEIVELLPEPGLLVVGDCDRFAASCSFIELVYGLRPSRLISLASSAIVFCFWVPWRNCERN